MAIAMDSDREYPSSPKKAGTLPSLLALRCSTEGPTLSFALVSMMSRSRPLAFATAKMAVVRGFFYSMAKKRY